MTLAYVQAISAFVTYLVLTWAALVIAVALLVPTHADHAKTQAESHTGKSLFVGIAMLVPFAVSLALIQGGPIMRLLAIVIWFCTACALVLGSAGIALVMRGRISKGSEFTGLLCGSLVYSLALGFPVIGWFFFLPVAVIASLGAGTRAIIAARNESQNASATPSDYDGFSNTGAAQ
jgi:hypothetical protein